MPALEGQATRMNLYNPAPAALSPACLYESPEYLLVGPVWSVPFEFRVRNAMSLPLADLPALVNTIVVSAIPITGTENCLLKTAPQSHS